MAAIEGSGYTECYDRLSKIIATPNKKRYTKHFSLRIKVRNDMIATIAGRRYVIL